MKTVRICTAVFAIALLQSCQPEKPEVPDPLIGKWQLVAMEEKSNNQWEDTYNDLEDCEKDNFLDFKPDQTLHIDEGATKCDAADPQHRAVGTWARSGAGQLKTVGLDTDEFRIVVLAGQELRLEVINNPAEEAKLTFKRLP